MKNDFLKKKEILQDEILSLREELLHVQEKINDIGEGNTFFKMFLIPFIISIVVFVVSKLFNLEDTKALGLFIITFIISITMTTIRIRKENKIIEESYIEDRIKIQHKIMEKVKELSEVDENIKNGDLDESN